MEQASALVSAPSTSVTDRLDEWIAYTHAIADWCLRNARAGVEGQSIEEALRWNTLAGWIFTLGCDPLASDELEGNLLHIARRLPSYTWTAAESRGTSKRWLHVMDHARTYGGHTAMAQRWITNDARNNIHSVVLLSQESSVPETLTRAVQESGGTVTLADPRASLLSRALSLRKLAFENADYVVLHVDCWNVIAPVAFGVEGGPPVLLVNHAAHIFWAGGSIADLVINCRGSQLETQWTVSYRGIPRCATLPIPLRIPERYDRDHIFSPQARAQAREALRVPVDAIVLLTVGRGSKYKPLPTLNFFEVTGSILSLHHQAYVLAVGPSEDSYWKALSERTGGRVRVIGIQPNDNLLKYHAAADVYLESFPFGSTTALLEAGLHGIPAVLAPGTCPPPFATDGIAIDDALKRPADVGEYVAMVSALVESAVERERCGRMLAESIARHHAGSGWANHLRRIVEIIPLVHTVSIPKAKSPPKAATYYWADIMSTWADYIGRYRGDPLEYPFRLAIESGVKPMMDVTLYRACRKARRVRSEGGAPASAFILLGFVLRVFPVSVGLVLYDMVIVVLRGNGLLRRSLRSLFHITVLPRKVWGWLHLQE